jgi:vanillate O-demethylase monooxygenase subunit
LSLGRIEGDRITCPYHGLAFDLSGTCVDNPHGKGWRPQSLCVRSYPVEASKGMLWIWMGEAARAATTRPPSYSFLFDPARTTVSGYLHVGANYELVADNLLDLSHAEYLHPFLAPPGSSRGIVYKAVQDGVKISAYHDMPGQLITPMFKLLVDPSVNRIDGRAHMHWEPPCNLMLETGAKPLDHQSDPGAEILWVHLLAPETETTTHYFWGASRDRVLDNVQLDQAFSAGVSNSFENEDEPMVRAVQSRMAGQELFSLNPVLMPMDEAAVRARRTLKRLIEAEQIEA